MSENIRVWLGCRLIVLASLVAPLRIPQALAVEPQSDTCIGCSLRLEKSTEIDGRNTESLNTRPVRVASDGVGHLILVRAASLPPTVFDGRGAVLGNLGRRGSGPGETMRPRWVDTSLDDDTIRVFEQGRVVLFTKDLKHARTVADRSPDCPMFLAVLRPGAYAMLSCRVGLPGNPTPNPILIRSDSGRLIRSIEQPLLTGNFTKAVFTRDLGRAGSMWLIQHEVRSFVGYRVMQLTETGKSGATFHRRPDWWKNGQITKATAHEPRSYVADARQTRPTVLTVVIATPRSDWAKIPVDTLTREGFWDRFETVVELLDLRTGKLIAAARAAGYPISIAAKDLVATYFQDQEGYPHLSVFRVVLTR